MNKFLLKIFVNLHNISYKVISKLAIKLNNGVHPKHKILDYHKFFVDNVDKNDNIIDVGCGKGNNAYDIASKAKHVVAIDIKEANIKYAKKHHHRENLDYIVGDVLLYDFNQKFDKIVFSNVLEHIEDRVGFLQKLHKISNIMLLRVPLLDRDWLTIYKKQAGLEYRLDQTHYIEYTISTLKDELSRSGWSIRSHSIQFGEFWGVIKRK